MRGWQVYRLRRQNGGDEAGSGLLLRVGRRTKGRFAFGWTGTSTWSRKYWTSGTARRIPFTKSVQMTAISTSCAGKHRRRTELGIWNHSGNCHARADLGG